MQEDDDPPENFNGFHLPRASAILALSGSSGSDSASAQLLDMAAEHAISLGADITILDLRHLDLPIYDDEIGEDQLPQAVLILRQMLSAHDGLILATPEYNGSVPTLLKNALDWSSRSCFGSDGLAPYRGKIAALMTVSRASTGGVSVLNHLRTILCRLGVLVMPEELHLAQQDLEGERAGLGIVRTRRDVARLVSQFHGLLRQNTPNIDLN
jgi:NAD(P)H-dependent FMN reductase